MSASSLDLSVTGTSLSTAGSQGVDATSGDEQQQQQQLPAADPLGEEGQQEQEQNEEDDEDEDDEEEVRQSLRPTPFWPEVDEMKERKAVATLKALLDRVVRICILDGLVPTSIGTSCGVLRTRSCHRHLEHSWWYLNSSLLMFLVTSFDLSTSGLSH